MGKILGRPQISNGCVGRMLREDKHGGPNAEDLIQRAPLYHFRIRLLRFRSRSSSALIQYSLFLARCEDFDQVPKLLGGEVVAFQVSGQASITTDNNSMKGMHEQGFIGIERHVETSAYPLNVCNRTGEETPTARVRFPCAGVAAQFCWLIMDRVDDDGEQNEVSSHTAFESSL